MSDHNVVIEGAILPAFDPESVHMELARLTRQPVERVRLLLAGKPTTVKRGVDLDTANSFVRALIRIGVASHAESIPELTLDLPPESEVAGIDAAASMNRATEQPRGIAAANATLTPGRAASPSIQPRQSNRIDDGNTVIPDVLWKSVAQTRAEYYVPKWKRYAAGESTFPSWHWPALFLSCWWALYRKSWAGAVAMFFVPLAVWIPILIATGATKSDESSGLLVLLGYAIVWFLPATLANGFYYRKAKSIIANAQALSPDLDTQIAYVTTRGGTSNSWLVAGIGIGGIVVIGILAAIAIPQYANYRHRAQVGEVLVAIIPLKTQIAEAYLSTGHLPQGLDYSLVKTSPGAQYIQDIEMTQGGAITVTFKGSGIEGAKLVLAPHTNGDTIEWTCHTVDVAPGFVPASCRN